MCQFLESIKLLDGEIYHLEWHQKRVNETFATFFSDNSVLNLGRLLSKEIVPKDGFFKIRIEYSSNAYSVEIQSYEKRNIQHFELVEIDFDYSFKFTDREKINALKKNSKADEVIFTKNDLILDSSYSNIALFYENQWVTPSSFLLNGTARQRLLAENQLMEKEITVQDLCKCQKISFINALNDLGENEIII